jgi:hypothetical protein
MTSLTLLLIVVVVVVVAAEELTCDNPMQHVSVLASCGKVAMRFDAAGDRFVSVPNSAQTLCGNGANRNVAVCSQLPEATGKFAAGVYSAGVFNFGWFWACADVARSQNCTQVKGNFVDCWFSPVAMPGASWAQRTQTTTAQREVVFFFFFFFSQTSNPFLRAFSRPPTQLVSIFNRVCLACLPMSPPITKRPARACLRPDCTVQAHRCWFDAKTWLFFLYCLLYGQFFFFATQSARRDSLSF